MLFLRSHSAFRAACEHATAGQIADAFPALRACLEYAAYALHIVKHPGLEEVWLRRHDNDTAKDRTRSEFVLAKLRDSIGCCNQKAAKIFQDLYQRTIDFGGHPNERSVTGNLRIIEKEDRKEFQQAYLHGDGVALGHTLKTTAQVGLCALEILREIYSPRFDLLGVSERMLKLRKGL
jgi:hypothetical protein